MYVADRIKEVLERLDLDIETIRNSPDTMCIIDPQFRLLAYNQAWVDFARSNDGADVLTTYPLGSSILTAFADAVKPFYTSAYASALRTHAVFAHDYECSSPDRYRLFHQTAYPLTGGTGLLITHHLIEEMGHKEQSSQFSPRFLDSHGHIIQCCHCRKIQDPSEHLKWIWVPEILRTPPHPISHTLCPRCLDFYYPAEE